MKLSEQVEAATGVDREVEGLVDAERSLLERAPNDLRISWGGAIEERWSIGVSCSIKTRNELRALIEILTILNAASDPAQGGCDERG